MGTAGSEKKTAPEDQKKLSRLYLDLLDNADIDRQLHSLAAIEWSSIETLDAIGLVSLASDSVHLEVRVLAATMLKGILKPLLNVPGVSQGLEEVCRAVGKMSRDTAPQVRCIIDGCLEALTKYPHLLTLTRAPYREESPPARYWAFSGRMFRRSFSQMGGLSSCFAQRPRKPLEKSQQYLANQCN